jgi:Skp family chaperone for outer membrane proteins
MRKNIIYTLSLALSIACSFLPKSSLAHKTMPVTNVAIVDIQRLFGEESYAAQDIIKQIKSKQKEVAKTIRDSEESLRSKHKEIERTKALMSEDAFKTKIESLNKEAALLEKDSVAKREMLANANAEAIQQLSEAISKTIKEKSQNMNIDLLLERSSAAHYDERLDITNEILTEFNKNVPSFKVNFVEPKDNQNNTTKNKK